METVPEEEQYQDGAAAVSLAGRLYFSSSLVIFLNYSRDGGELGFGQHLEMLVLLL